MAIVRKEYFGIARKIVSNMTSESWQDIPHATMSYEADVTEMMPYYKKLNEGVTDKSKKITLNTLMIKVICEGLTAAPKMNCTLHYRKYWVRGTLNYQDEINVSMPVLLNTGEMMTINMHDMGRKTLVEMTDHINDKVRRAANSDMNEVMYQVSLSNTLHGLKNGHFIQTVNRLLGSKLPGHHRVNVLTGKAKREYYKIPESDRLTKYDIEQGTTTISNLGSIYKDQKGLCMLLEIIPPQTTAFAVNAIQEMPKVVKSENDEKEIQIRKILPITIAIDHRSLDYDDCLPFFKRLDDIFANPAQILEWK